mmetsp:Transcript_62256/g.145998  ORF Transcript_62256/g.145998 Transcript_62256/m.145998 type:complete len:248 (-) Transcript_62256:978-1721(-)
MMRPLSPKGHTRCPPVDPAVVQGIQGLHKFHLGDASVTVLIEGQEELRGLRRLHADAHLRDQVAEFVHLQFAVPVVVELREQLGHVLGRVAKILQPPPRLSDEDDAVPISPGLGHGIPQDRQRHRHEQHAHEAKRASHHLPRPADRIHVTGTHGGDRDSAKVDGGAEGIHRVGLQDVEGAAEDQDDQADQEEQKLQGIHSGGKDVQQQLELLELPDQFQLPHHRHVAVEEEVGGRVLGDGGGRHAQG